MRVLVAEDQEIVRAALRRFLAETPDITLVSEVVSATNLLAQARETQPDLVVLDWELAGLLPDDSSGSRRTRDQARRQLFTVLHALPSQPQIIALSREPEMRLKALAAGADGFCSKGDPPERFLMTLQAVAAKGDRL